MKWIQIDILWSNDETNIISKLVSFPEKFEVFLTLNIIYFSMDVLRIII